MRIFTPSEGVLVANLGVYGVWLCKHAPKLPQHLGPVQSLMGAYEVYVRAKDPRTGMNLIAAVDHVVEELLWEAPLGDYELACYDYIHEGDLSGWRGTMAKSRPPVDNEAHRLQCEAENLAEELGIPLEEVQSKKPKLRGGHNDAWLSTLRLRVPAETYRQAARVYNDQGQEDAAILVRKMHPTLAMEGLPPAEDGFVQNVPQPQGDQDATEDPQGDRERP